MDGVPQASSSSLFSKQPPALTVNTIFPRLRPIESSFSTTPKLSTFLFGGALDESRKGWRKDPLAGREKNKLRLEKEAGWSG